MIRYKPTNAPSVPAKKPAPTSPEIANRQAEVIYLQPRQDNYGQNRNGRDPYADALGVFEHLYSESQRRDGFDLLGNCATAGGLVSIVGIALQNGHMDKAKLLFVFGLAAALTIKYGYKNAAAIGSEMKNSLLLLPEGNMKNIATFCLSGPEKTWTKRLAKAKEGLAARAKNATRIPDRNDDWQQQTALTGTDNLMLK